MTRVETYLNENLRKRLDQVEQVRRPFKCPTNTILKEKHIDESLFSFILPVN